MHIDPITVEIIKGALRAAVREMGLLIERTAMSAFIREKKDFFAGMYDARASWSTPTMTSLARVWWTVSRAIPGGHDGAGRRVLVQRLLSVAWGYFPLADMCFVAPTFSDDARGLRGCLWAFLGYWGYQTRHAFTPGHGDFSGRHCHSAHQDQ